MDPLTALTNSFQVVQKVGEVFQDFHSAQLQQAMAMSQPLTREQSVSAQRSIGHVLAPPYDKAEHERLQQKVHELEEWQAQQQAQLRAKDEDALRTATQYRAEQARLQARHDEAAAAAAVAAAERSAEREVAEAARLEAEERADRAGKPPAIPTRENTYVTAGVRHTHECVRICHS